MILDRLLAHARSALVQRQTATPEGALRERLADVAPALDLAQHLSEPGVSIIAEIKRTSPSRGVLKADLDAGLFAVAYASAGAQAISVLTEKSHFGGSLEDLGRVRSALATAGVARSLLRKDFIIDSYQLLEARVFGADAVLLIAAALDDQALATLLEQALTIGLAPLVEVHNQGELDRVLPLEPPMVGINNRDLSDFSVDLEVTRRLRPLIPPGVVVVSESGIHEPGQVRELRALGVDAALIGQALVTALDPVGKLKELKEAGQ